MKRDGALVSLSHFPSLHRPYLAVHFHSLHTLENSVTGVGYSKALSACPRLALFQTNAESNLHGFKTPPKACSLFREYWAFHASRVKFPIVQLETSFYSCSFCTLLQLCHFSDANAAMSIRCSGLRFYLEDVTSETACVRYVTRFSSSGVK